MASEPSVDCTAPLEGEVLEACSFERWYPLLKHVSQRSLVLPLDEAFVTYLRADSVFVPGDEDGDDGDDGDWSDAAPVATSSEPDPSQPLPDDDDDTSEPLAQPNLESIAPTVTAIRAAITRLGGAVLPKLNWSAPTDAAWVLGGSPKCTSANDVLLLLKSSDRTAHDLDDARANCTPHAAQASLTPHFSRMSRHISPH
tara:strand:- start:1895 stop:2491 length:597 start_codon:yes stop_codon:yes gene_type:complete